MSKFIVVAVDYGETTNGHSTLLTVCDTKEEAKEYIKNDIEDYADSHTTVSDDGMTIYPVVDFHKMEAWIVNGVDGCVWDIHEITD